LQRSPSYIMPVPSEDAIANALRKLLARNGYAVTRRKNIAQQGHRRFCKRIPKRHGD